jgi:putative N6-adenine-specific DNA methylase
MKREINCVVVPGFEASALAEFDFWKNQLDWSVESQKKIKGGILIEADESLVPELNQYLKVPTRIYLRIGSFKAKHEVQLKEGLLGINFEDYLFGKPTVNFSAIESRLYHKQKMKEICERALKKRSSLDSDEKQTVLIRNHRNQIEVSVDTSGELLFKRESDRWKGRAPLRESLVSGVLWSMISKIKSEDLAREISKVTLVDPMAGSGTFLLEGHNLFSLNSDRHFAFENFPSFKKKTTKGGGAAISFKGFWANDNNPVSLKALDHNTKNLPKIKVTESDAFDLTIEESSHPIWIVSNPPLGHRLNKKSDLDFYSDFLSYYVEVLKPEKMAVLLPTEFDPKTVDFSLMEVEDSFVFDNNTLKVRLLQLKKI